MGYIGSLYATALAAVSLYAQTAVPQVTYNPVPFIQSASARPLGMGGSFTWQKGDAACIHFNPGGLAAEGFLDVSVNYEKGEAERSALTVDSVLKMGPGALGVSVAFHNMGSLEMYDSLGTLRTVAAQSDNLITLAYAVSLLGFLRAGAALAFCNSVLLEDYTANAFTMDIGAQADIAGFIVGAAVRNLGSDLDYAGLSEKVRVPDSYRAGVGYAGTNVSAGVDIIKNGDADAQYAVGAEYAVLGFVPVRIGYQTAPASREDATVTGGVGVRLSLFRVDYALSVAGGSAGHKLSVGLSF